MKIETKFDIYQKVLIKDLDNFPGIVIEIALDGTNLYYNLNGEIKTVKLCEWQLAEVKA